MTMSLEPEWTAADFDLPAANPSVDCDGKARRSLSDYAAAEIVVIVFTCNHCPYAVHVEHELTRIATDYKDRGVQLIAICSNDAVRYPADGFQEMSVRAREAGFTFPYLHDETQAVARTYTAVCTPDTFVFDRDRTLAYRGQIDGTRPGAKPSDGIDLRRALDALLAHEPIRGEQRPSVGCSIKWRK